MRDLAVSVGGKHNARVKKTWRGTFAQFVASLLSKVPETEDKASNGWVCAVEFDPPYRDSENFVARHLLSLDYDHIKIGDFERLLSHYRGVAHLAFTTWTHRVQKPRLRVWLPLSRPCSYDEFQAISRRVAADAPGGIELAARESHTPAQYYFRPTVAPFEEFQHWENLEGPWIDVDAVLAAYEDWTDRTSWPHRAEGDGVHNEGAGTDPRTKPGVIGAFCRAFSISDAIERFGLPYTRGSSDGRLTYTDGSRPDGAIIYDDDTKLHSHHDTDPARGQTNAYDLVRLHQFGYLDSELGSSVELAKRPSSLAMQRFALSQRAVGSAIRDECGFVDLDEADAIADTGWLDGGAGTAAGRGLDSGSVLHAAPPGLPERIKSASSKLTDQENARRIQKRDGDKLISIGGAFYRWEDTHWALGTATKNISALSQLVKAEAEKLETDLAEKAAKEGRGVTADEEAQVVMRRRWAMECGQKSRIANCTSLLKDLLDFKAENLNNSTYLFSCVNGTLDLRTGEIRKHDPKDFITACSPVAYDPHAEAPRFKRFLTEVVGEPDVVEFAQRWFGYCITGDVSEHKMVFHVGGGGNGKSTLMDLLSYVLGSDYYSTAAQKLLALDTTGATPDLARLLGRRMVTITETDDALELREGIVKQLTGGDKINARMLYRDPIEFHPTHKLQIFTNFPPQIKSQDFAIWRRILLLDYPNSYGDADQVARGEARFLGDPHLERTLKAEAPGVLRWLVEGARSWYEGRLRPPAAVLTGTMKYRAEQDRVGAFAVERLVKDLSARTALAGQAGSVYNAYRGWCSSMGYHPIGRTRFVKEIQRAIPSAKETTWAEQGLRISGFTGFRLTEAILDD